VTFRRQASEEGAQLASALVAKLRQSGKFSAVDIVSSEPANSTLKAGYLIGCEVIDLEGATVGSQVATGVGAKVTTNVTVRAADGLILGGAQIEALGAWGPLAVGAVIGGRTPEVVDKAAEGISVFVIDQVK